MDKTIDTQHFERSATGVDHERHTQTTLRDVKRMTVQSVALADAIAKDAPNYRSATQFKLYAMMAFCVMSKSHSTVQL